MKITVGDFCKLLNPDDAICVWKGENGFAAGEVQDMTEYYGEEIYHISADRSPIAYRKNNCIMYDLHVK